MSGLSSINRRRLLQAGATAATISAFPGILRAADTVRIGFLAPLSGALAMVGQSNQNCLTLAVDEINAAGGLAGRKLEIVAEDSQMSTKTSVDKARKLFTQDNVIAVTGMVLPSEREAVLSVATAVQGLVLYPNFDEGRCHRSLITTGLAANQSTVPMAKWLTDHVGKSMAILASDLGTNRDIFGRMFKGTFERAGGQIQSIQYFPFGTRDFGPALQQIQAAKPDIVWHAIGDDPITFIKQYASFGMKPQLVTQLAHESIAAATEGAATGVISVESSFMSVDTPANKAFIAAHDKRFANFTPRRVRGHVTLLPHNERTYVSAKLLAEAVRRGGGIGFEEIRRGMADATLDAPRGSLRVDAASGHMLCDTLVGKVAADGGIDVIERLAPTAPACTGGSGAG